MDSEILQHTARLVRISVLSAIQDLALRHLSRGLHLDDFLVDLKMILEKEMDAEGDHMLRTWSVRMPVRRLAQESLSGFVRPATPSP